MLELRAFIDEMGAENEICLLTDDQWNDIKVLERVLFEPYRLTMIVQENDCKLGDFYGVWLQAKVNIEKIQHDMAKCLLNCMINREKKLFQHKVMLSAVYFDPRYNFLLNERERAAAALHLCELFLRLQNIIPVQVTGRVESATTADDPFAIFLNNAAKKSIDSVPIGTQILTQEQILYKIRSFSSRPSVHYKTNIMDYWNNLKFEEPQLYELAIVLLSVPVSQVSVERAFSSLSYIFNNYRSRLSPNVLNQVLLLRLNYELAPRPHEYVSKEDFMDEDDICLSSL